MIKGLGVELLGFLLGKSGKMGDSGGITVFYPDLSCFADNLWPPQWVLTTFHLTEVEDCSKMDHITYYLDPTLPCIYLENGNFSKT